MRQVKSLLMLRSPLVGIIRSHSFRLVKFIRPISFLVFPRPIGRETPPPTCEFSSLDLAEQTKSRRKYLHFFICFSFYNIPVGQLDQPTFLPCVLFVTARSSILYSLCPCGPCGPTSWSTTLTIRK